MTENAIVATTQEQLVNRTRLVDGCEVQTFGTEIVDCNILEAEAGTNLSAHQRYSKHSVVYRRLK